MYCRTLIPTPATHSSGPEPLRGWTAALDPVATVGPKHKWLVPVDGTPASMSAVEYVIAHADRARTHLHLLNVQPTIMAGDVSVVASAKLVADLRRSAGERALSAAKALLDRHSLQHTSEVVFGAPAQAIVRGAAERRCAKIVIGARGVGVIANIAGCSVSGRVVRLSHVPVTLVKPENAPASRKALLQHDAA
jgi:nucleotide-binding universal stress UspA family protein